MSSGGAEAPSEATTAELPTTDAETLAKDSIDLEDLAKEADPEEAIEDSEAVSEEPKRRDIKMMSYEEAMALPIEIGDATSEGGESQLSAADVARVMDEHLDEMYEECIRKELERGNVLGTVTVDLAIRGGDGAILGTTIEPGRRRFKKCIASYLEDVRFPKFASPRMGARYRFHAT